MEEEDLKKIFEEYGEVVSAKVITDKFTGKGKGFGFVEMADENQALEAIQALDGNEFEGRRIRVNEAIEREAVVAAAVEMVEIAVVAVVLTVHVTVINSSGLM